MSFIDDLAAAVRQSQKLSDPARQLIDEFLTNHRDLLERLGADATQEFFQSLALQGADAAYDTVVAHLGEAQLLELLRGLGPQMDAAIDHRAQAIADTRAWAQAVGQTALSVLTRLILAAL